MRAIAILGLLTLIAILITLLTTARKIPGIIRNRLLYKLQLTKEEQAKVEKNLSRLTRVIVMCDRVDPPTSGFLDAVRDNLKNGVSYLFLVSDRATDRDIEQYREVFKHIEIAVRADESANVAIGGERLLPENTLSQFFKLKQDWDDYPYICYEFLTESDATSSSFLMYRGNEIGVGIASRYTRISPETAYSLVRRAGALKDYLDSDPTRFVDSSAGAMDNSPADNVVDFKRTGS